MFDPDSFRHTHEKILKAIGAEHIRFHDLRHTFATLSLKYGVDVKTLSGALGHYDAGFTLSTYTHATEGMKRDARGGRCFPLLSRHFGFWVTVWVKRKTQKCRITFQAIYEKSS